MKKLLIATTALVAGASAAAADVTISGYGRFGLEYIEDRAGFGGPANVSDTVVSSRLRFNVDATTETDVGVTFGARVRVQIEDEDAGGSFNQALFTVGYEGLTVGVGNVETAYDSVALTYNSEMGFQDFSYGDSDGGNASNFYAYDSTGAGGGYTGVSATYSISDINLYFSYVNPNQYVKDLGIGVKEEIGIAADWTNGQFSVAGSFVSNAGSIDGNDLLFIGAAYNFGDGNVGLNYYDQDRTTINAIAGVNSGASQVTLYGDYTFGATTVKAYISDMDLDDNTNTDTAYGIGADYSLGEGARLSGSIQSGWGDTASGWTRSGTRADLGVRFDF